MIKIDKIHKKTEKKRKKQYTIDIKNKIIGQKNCKICSRKG